MKWMLCLLFILQTIPLAALSSVELDGTDGSSLLIQFDSDGQVASMVSSDGLVSDNTPSGYLPQIFYKYAAHLKPLKNHIAKLFNHDDVLTDVAEIGNDWLPDSVFFFFGFRQEEVNTGTVGRFNFSDKVRFTVINGVLNNFESVRESAQMISDYTGGVRIHFVCRPSSGWPGDLFEALLTMSGLKSPIAEHLAGKWRELIQEMGGPHGGGRIIHYSHSLGGVDTVGAKELLLPEEAAMIEVYAFATPRAVPSDGFHYVMNYCTSRDQVWFLDPVGYYKHNVVFLESTGVHGYDHRWCSPAYTRVLEELGTKWVNLYGLHPNENGA